MTEGSCAVWWPAAVAVADAPGDDHGGKLQWVYVPGSAALGDFAPGRSDLDVLDVGPAKGLERSLIDVALRERRDGTDPASGEDGVHDLIESTVARLWAKRERPG